MKIRYMALLLIAISAIAWAGSPRHSKTMTSVSSSKFASSRSPTSSQGEEMNDAAPQPLITARVYPGSLKRNIMRIAAENGWEQVIWNVPYDYEWVGTKQIRSHGLAGILATLLHGYPLEAVFFTGNHILTIKPKILK